MVDLEAWRELVREAALAPELPIIDCHHHLWNEAPAPVFEPYPFELALKHKTSSGHNIVASVYLEANSHYYPDGPEHLRPVGETAYIDKMAEAAARQGGKAAGFCAGIIPHADLTRGSAVREVLEEHRAASPKRLRGIRHRTPYDPDNPLHSGPEPETMKRADFRTGMKVLTSMSLTFDAMVLHPQLPEMTDLARACPDTTIVLNHIGAPLVMGRYAGKSAEVFAQWSKSMAELATCPNVMVKIGGMNMDFTGLSFVGERRPPTSEQLAARQRDYVLKVIDLFEPQRCMFESNFPVDMLGVSYTVVWNTFKRLTADFSAADRAALFHDTAARVYRLDA